ncbi:uncharacterized protein N7482_000055 [Penicillium canariense]|uniref:Uncharacterized protein n=1 Tax=Penicillium canariense TaxID=189055 RepID=A0A9W9ICL4_9EURO|nr:uncharacterized protein N7482_000055 [Penicillium canariense]KAJ5174178.1 hypothetical protein N7482_000055 [Penicillium canariense]
MRFEIVFVLFAAVASALPRGGSEQVASPGNRTPSDNIYVNVDVDADDASNSHLYGHSVGHYESRLAHAR